MKERDLEFKDTYRGYRLTEKSKGRRQISNARRRKGRGPKKSKRRNRR